MLAAIDILVVLTTSDIFTAGFKRSTDIHVDTARRVMLEAVVSCAACNQSPWSTI